MPDDEQSILQEAQAKLDEINANPEAAADESNEPELEFAAEQVAPEATPAPEATAQEPVVEEPEVEDFVPRADLESLLEGVEDEKARESIITAYKSFQRGFTEKSQKIAGLQRAFEGIDPNQAREAFDFVQNLTSDRAFAAQVHAELAQALEAAGASPAQAEAEATRQVESVQAGAVEDWGIDPDNPLVKEVQELKQWKVEQSAREVERDLKIARDAQIRDIERMDAEVRRQHPGYDEGDMGTIYRFAASMGGDLFAAQEAYEAEKDRLVTAYVAQKAAAPKAQAAPSAAAHSEEPMTINTVKEAHEAAPEVLKRILATQGE